MRRTLAIALIAASGAMGCTTVVQRPIAVTPVATRYDAEETLRITHEGHTRVLHGPFTIQRIDDRVFLDAADGSLAGAPARGTSIERDVVVPDHSSDWVWYVVGALAGAVLGVVGGLAGQ